MARTANYDRDAALDAAMTLFWGKGYHATSLKDLEAALTLKPGSIYAAFESKQNLYLLAMSRYFAISRQGFRDQIASADSPLAGLAGHYINFASLPESDAARQACMLTKTLVDTNTTDETIASASKDYLDQMCAEITDVFRAAQNAGEIPENADPERLARRFQANITALRVEMHRGSSREMISALAEDMAAETLTLGTRSQARH
ncbi:AcrR family transcriptional regulator [Loktanella ponticola]|uniref:AcrR family transcriptional regulator n=1 Tax=Yoonia ponticola TaxID=1524255 RepID=A0A7W9BHJ3_9RHOB|nr:TetR/AcrR family transcriptional regulator [Yoonia ponticola]MBB5720561.1 AcrR family transcriptional regulator [Yoonia ponticola]